jgi:hypothetical protein
MADTSLTCVFSYPTSEVLRENSSPPKVGCPSGAADSLTPFRVLSFPLSVCGKQTGAGPAIGLSGAEEKAQSHLSFLLWVD